MLIERRQRNPVAGVLGSPFVHPQRPENGLRTMSTTTAAMTASMSHAPSGCVAAIASALASPRPWNGERR